MTLDRRISREFLTIRLAARMQFICTRFHLRSFYDLITFKNPTGVINVFSYAYRVRIILLDMRI